MKCAACGADNKENAKFCRGCGGKLSQEGKQSSSPDNSMKPCPVCQGMVREKAKFCQKCGHNFGNAPTDIASSALPSTLPTITSSETPGEEISSATTSSLEDLMPCPACGGQVKRNAKFCGKCGFSFVASIPPEPSEDIGTQADAAPEASGPAELLEETVVHAEKAQEEQETYSSNPEIVPQAAHGGDIARKRNSVNVALLGVALVFAISGIGYWQFSAKKAGEPVLQEAQAEVAPDVAVEPASSVSVAETKGENELPSQVAQAPSEAAVSESKIVPSEKKASQPASAKASAKTKANEEPEHSTAPVVAAKPPVALPPARNVKLDSQSESMLAMGEQMYAGNMSSGALDAANQVLKKYPGNPRATKLKNKAQAKIDQQMASIQKSIK